ncbi:hypothetical protein DFP74_6583 [Nocardiopsis sp. Huas11]|uniref:hypothetical protein n=1 Tax=Nocardiopsis sp. Huas11 TaxID=2183912 RepID=UPI000F2BC78B|nr:hypothetical protein [Nocardiopsis sp. Huas11]RKS10801.1 hypothetical protein DFP74_6583 [Nocardiopsis sp. Huas11]
MSRYSLGRWFVLTEYVRDHAFTVAWFGLMSMVWFGWGQEDPPGPWRWRLGVASVLGIALAGLFGVATALSWSGESALDGRYHWFGVLVGVEVIAAGLGCLLFARSGNGRWMAWWVAVIVASHFLPLAVLLDDVSIAAVGVVQGIALALLVPRLRRSEVTTSRYVGPVMGVVLLGFAAVSAALFVAESGLPWRV